MEFYNINLTPFRRKFWTVLIVCCLLILGSLYVVKLGFYVIDSADTFKTYIRPLLILMVFVSIAHTYDIKRRVKAIQKIEDFQVRGARYERLYAYRIYWYLVACGVSCVIAILCGVMPFIYLAIYDLVLMLPYFPNKRLFRNDLGNEDIVFLTR